MKRIIALGLIIAFLTSSYNSFAQGGILWYKPDTQLFSDGATWSTPLVMDGRIYWQCQDGGMNCIDALTGATLWIDTSSVFGSTLHSPIGYANAVYTSSPTGFVGFFGPTNTQLWRRTDITSVQYTTPIGFGAIFVATNDSIVALNLLTGATIWNVPIKAVAMLIDVGNIELIIARKDSAMIQSLDPGNGSINWTANVSDPKSKFSGMAKKDNKIIVTPESSFPDSASKVYCIDAITHNVIWERGWNLNQDYSPDGGAPVIVDSLVIVATRQPSGSNLQRVRALGLSAGTEVWSNAARNTLAGRTPQLAALGNEVFYERADTLQAGWIAVDAHTGNESWIATPDSSFTGSWGSVAIWNNRMYAAPDFAGLYCFDAGTVNGQWRMYGGNHNMTNQHFPSDMNTILSGMVYNGTSPTPVTAGQVLAYEYQTPPAPMVLWDSTDILANGSFYFPTVPLTDLVILAKPDNSAFPTTVATYHPSAPDWADATVVTVSEDVIGIDIDADILAPLSGPGRIAGFVVHGNLGKMGPGDPFEGVGVNVNSGGTTTPLASTTSASDGSFEFTNVPIGNYSCWVNVTGVPTDSNLYVITATDTVIENILMTVDSDRVQFGWVSYTGDLVDENAITVFPNPVRQKLYISLDLNRAAEFSIEIFDMMGQRQKLINTWVYEGPNRMVLNVEGLLQGVYFYRVQSELVSESGKFVKVE